jgi:D-alanine-D-alanine ligase
MKRKLRVGVIFGGRSGEHDVSLRSARSVIEAMDQKKYEVVPIAITKDGEWRLQPERGGLLEKEDLALPSEPQVIPAVADFLSAVTTSLQRIADPAVREMVTLDADQKLLPSQPLDIVFPVLHGTYGEDGTIQGLLEMKGVPYVGCGVLASASGMDKVTMKALFRDAGLPVCKYIWFLRSAWETGGAALLRRVAREIGYPCFVKPANLGSSVGVSKATDRRSLKKAIELAARYDRKIIVEEGLDAREIECGVMGNDEPVASVPGEYEVYSESAKFLDYTEKYAGTGNVEFVVPARINKSLTKRIQQMATRAFQSVDGAGLARVDFFLTRGTNHLIINELNTMPGLTDASGFPKMWEASGLSMPRVVDRLIQLALARHKEKSRNETSI